MQVYLVRHTTPDIAKEICYGQSDLEINTQVFEKELKQIRSKLPLDIEKFYTSPLKRCEKLCESLSLEYEIDPRLMELNFGEWELKEWETIPKIELNPWIEDYVNLSPPKGESYQTLHNRCIDFLEDLTQIPYKKVAVITHAGNIRSMISHLLGTSLENSFRIQLSYGMVVEFKLNKELSWSKLISMQPLQ